MRENYQTTERYYYDDKLKAFMFTLKGKINENTREIPQAIDQPFDKQKSVFPCESHDLMLKIALNYKLAYDELSKLCLANNQKILDLMVANVTKNNQ